MFPYGQFFNTSRGKNAIENLYLQKAILLLDSEIELLKLQVWQPQSLLSEISQPQKVKVYFIPKSEGLGIDSMGEFALTLDLSKQFLDEGGKPVPFIHIAHTLEYAFNFTFGNAYKSKYRIFSRKPYNLTKALDYLRKLLIRESRDKKIIKR